MVLRGLAHALNSPVGIAVFVLAISLLTDLRVWRRLGEDRNRYSLQFLAAAGTVLSLLALLLAIAGSTDPFLVVSPLSMKLGILTSVIAPPKKWTVTNIPSSSP